MSCRPLFSPGTGYHFLVGIYAVPVRDDCSALTLVQQRCHPARSESESAVQGEQHKARAHT